MTYSVESWRKAFLSVMMEDQTRKWVREELEEAAYQWLIHHNIPEEKDD